MYDDIIKKQKGFIWDFDQYEKKPYCPVCGSADVKSINDRLTSKHVEKDMKCSFCGVEWQEIRDKDIHLKLKEVILCHNGRVYWWSCLLSYGFYSQDV